MSVLEGRNILVTGGTGSFGNAFVRRALADGVKRIVVFSRDELKQAQMRAEIPDERVRYFIGDVTRPERVIQAMNGCDTVVHAAAMKRIEVAEANPWQACEINISGTYNVAWAAKHCDIQNAILLSTDKAPNACTLYGMTKAVAERLWIRSNVYTAGSATMLSAVRYGNVIASRGSVVGLFREQHRNGEPLTVTDPDMTRFWMRLSDAVDLVILALETQRGGEILIPKAPSSPIIALAAAIAGFPAEIKVVGLRGLERMHETLISADEARTTYDAGTHYIIEPEDRSWGDTAPLPYPKVPDGFVYRSDNNAKQIGVEELKALVAA